MPDISVITIVRNDLPALAGTAASVLSQSGVDYEFIVVDGSDTPDTTQIHHQLKAAGAQLLIGLDSGIYDAMSKGATAAVGQYLIFMNAGDSFAAPTSLKALFDCLTRGGHQWAYARAAVMRDGRPWRKPVGIYPYWTIRHAYARAAICHQSVLMSRSLYLALGGFDPVYGLQADVALLLAAGRAAKPGVLRQVEVHYDATGISTVHVESALRNKSRIRSDLFSYRATARALDSVFTEAQWRYVKLRQRLARVKLALLHRRTR